MAREKFKSNLGFILVSAGCAIGIGNVWKFPYVAGENGGGIFVLFYLLFLAIMGIPVLTMELAVGRASRKSTVEGYKALEKPGHKWHLHGWVCTAGCYLLMMYYTVVSGWMFGYFVKFASGTFDGLTGSGQVEEVYNNMISNPTEMIIWTFITIALGFVVCSFGLQGGVEKITKWMMIGLLALIVVLVVNSITLDNAAAGLKFYLLPDFARAKESGIINVMTAAMNQAFFTLSIGIASMEIFGSYMSDKKSILGQSISICSLDTFVAVMSGLIIFPACFSFSVDPRSGPPLIFEALPTVFIDMTGGRIWGSLFFLFMTFASLSTVIAVFENLIASSIENFKWSRKKASIINGLFIAVASLPCIFGFNLLSGFTIGGKNVLDMEDFIVSNVLLPGGAIVYLLFCVSKWGWGFDKYIAEVNKGEGLKMPRAFKPYFQFVLPVLILIILINGLIPA